MGSTESDLKTLENATTLIGAAIGILGGISAALGLVSFFGAGGS